MRSHCCVCVYVSPLSLRGNGSVEVTLSLLGNGSVKITLSLLGKRLGRNITAVTNKHATIKELLDSWFSIWPVSYQGKSAISYFQNFLFFNPLKTGAEIAQSV
jgi:hypothetical protein